MSTQQEHSNNDKYSVTRYSEKHFGIVGNENNITCRIHGQQVQLVLGVELVSLYEVGHVDDPDTMGLSSGFHVHPDDVSEYWINQTTNGRATDTPYSVYDSMLYSSGAVVKTTKLVEMCGVDESLYNDHKGGITVHGHTEATTLIDAIANNFDPIAGMIGFVLDSPVNRIGATGWDILQKQLGDKDAGLTAPLTTE